MSSFIEDEGQAVTRNETPEEKAQRIRWRLQFLGQPPQQPALAPLRVYHENGVKVTVYPPMKAGYWGNHDGKQLLRLALISAGEAPPASLEKNRFSN